ncbi:MAG: DUF4835 family protein [Paludibacteraceae bacterium]|nr:DUF4835 family protein [Paludibacteraceae bacterium]MEE3482789.1 DUF4835 family protein [Bacteroidales bacterium]
MSLRSIILGCFFICLSSLNAQEIKCHIQMNTEKIEGTNKDIYNELSNDLTEFINSRKWTDATFTEDERIECTFIFTLESAAGENYSGKLQIQASRPVYNSGYSTTLFNFMDNNLQFTYTQYQRFEFDENVYESNLLSTIAYYVNIILGLNFDSFSRYGGTKYFEKAELICALAQTSDDIGWKAFDSDRNRYALVSNYMDDRLKKLRDINYEYHRFGLDEMVNSTEKGRTNIYNNLPYLRDMNRAVPYSVALQNFVESKLNELLDMFQPATAKEKKDVYDILQSILPTESSKFKELLN